MSTENIRPYSTTPAQVAEHKVYIQKSSSFRAGSVKVSASFQFERIARRDRAFSHELPGSPVMLPESSCLSGATSRMSAAHEMASSTFNSAPFHYHGHDDPTRSQNQDFDEHGWKSEPHLSPDGRCTDRRCKLPHAPDNVVNRCLRHLGLRSKGRHHIGPSTWTTSNMPELPGAPGDDPVPGVRKAHTFPLSRPESELHSICVAELPAWQPPELPSSTHHDSTTQPCQVNEQYRDEQVSAISTRSPGSPISPLIGADFVESNSICEPWQRPQYPDFSLETTNSSSVPTPSRTSSSSFDSSHIEHDRPSQMLDSSIKEDFDERAWSSSHGQVDDEKETWLPQMESLSHFGSAMDLDSMFDEPATEPRTELRVFHSASNPAVETSRWQPYWHEAGPMRASMPTVRLLARSPSGSDLDMLVQQVRDLFEIIATRLTSCINDLNPEMRLSILQVMPRCPTMEGALQALLSLQTGNRTQRLCGLVALSILVSSIIMVVVDDDEVERYVRDLERECKIWSAAADSPFEQETFLLLIAHTMLQATTPVATESLQPGQPFNPELSNSMPDSESLFTSSGTALHICHMYLDLIAEAATSRGQSLADGVQWDPCPSRNFASRFKEAVTDRAKRTTMWLLRHLQHTARRVVSYPQALPTDLESMDGSVPLVISTVLEATLHGNHDRGLRQIVPNRPVAATSLPLSCSACKKQFEGKWASDHYRRHRRETHSGTRFKCMYCTKTFSRPNNRNRHQRERHSVLCWT